DVAHGADPPDPSGERPEGGADLDPEILEQLAPHIFSRCEAARDHHPRHVGHAVPGIAEELKTHGLEPGAQGATGEPVAGGTRLETFLEHNAGALARRIEHGGGLGVMVEALRRPVIHEHGEVEVVGAYARAPTLNGACALEPLLYVPARRHHRAHPLV